VASLGESGVVRGVIWLLLLLLLLWCEGLRRIGTSRMTLRLCLRKRWQGSSFATHLFLPSCLKTVLIDVPSPRRNFHENQLQ